jgi:hypothetical protein
MLTPPIPLHLSGPPDESAQLAVSIRPRADPASGESWFRSCTFGGSKHKRQATVKIWALQNWRRGQEKGHELQSPGEKYPAKQKFETFLPREVPVFSRCSSATSQHERLQGRACCFASAIRGVRRERSAHTRHPHSSRKVTCDGCWRLYCHD